MKAIEQYFPMVLFILLHKVFLTFKSVDKIPSVTIQTKAIEQYFTILPCKVISGFASFLFCGN